MPNDIGFRDIPDATVVANIDAWLAELAKPRRRQAKGTLQKNNAYCCLGVACRFVLKLESERVMPIGKDFYFFAMDRNGKEDNCISGMPGCSYEQVGLWEEDGARRTDSNEAVQLTCNSYMGDYGSSLAVLNDEGHTFAQIRERLLVDLRTDALGFFHPSARRAWRQHHGFTY